MQLALQSLEETVAADFRENLFLKKPEKSIQETCASGCLIFNQNFAEESSGGAFAKYKNIIFLPFSVFKIRWTKCPLK